MTHQLLKFLKWLINDSSKKKNNDSNDSSISQWLINFSMTHQLLEWLINDSNDSSKIKNNDSMRLCRYCVASDAIESQVSPSLKSIFFWGTVKFFFFVGQPMVGATDHVLKKKLYRDRKKSLVDPRVDPERSERARKKVIFIAFSESTDPGASVAVSNKSQIHLWHFWQKDKKQ